MNSKTLMTLMTTRIDVRGDKPLFLDGRITESLHSNLPIELTLSGLLGQIKAGEDHLRRVSLALDNMRALADSVLQTENTDTPDESRQARDLNGIALQPGDSVILIDPSVGGDSDELWDLKIMTEYEVDALHDEDHLLMPMILIKGSQAGPVFPERFVRIAKGNTTPLHTLPDAHNA